MKEANTQKPLVSIVIPCYNHEKYVQECIKSVIEQDYENIELIIIDDGSKDESVNKIQELVPQCEKRFSRFEFRTRPNKGLCATLNEALAWCEGEFYSPIASDDIMFTYKIRLQVDAFKKKDDEKLVGVFGGIELIDEYSSLIKRKKAKSKFYFYQDIILRKARLYTPTSLIRRDVVLGVKGYDERFDIEDLQLWLKLSSRGYFFYTIDKVLVKYRQDSTSLSKRYDLMWKNVENILNQHKDSFYYVRGYSESLVIHAHDLSTHSPIQAFDCYKRAFRNYPRIIFSHRSIKFFLKIIIVKVKKNFYKGK